MNPWMTPAEIKLLESYLKPSDVMLEWGSGGSTLYFSQFVKKYYSIEHDENWFLKLGNELDGNLWEINQKKIIEKDNITMFFVKENFPKTNPVMYPQFRDYIEFIKHIKSNFDKVLIDGRARVWCAMEVKTRLNKNGLVFIHDIERPRYWKVFKYYDKVEIIEKLAVLKPK